MTATKNMLNEIGDLKGIQPFEFSTERPEDGYFGVRQDDFILIIKFDHINYAEVEYFLPALDPDMDIAVDCHFLINGVDVMGMKTSVELYMRILKTVTEAIRRYAAAIHPDVILFSGNDKDGQQSISNNDNVKSRIYKAIVRQNNLPGYASCEKEMDNGLHTCLYDSSKYKESDIQKVWEPQEEIVENLAKDMLDNI